MIINIKGKEQELAFTFASFKHMQSFNAKDIALIESEPFRILDTVEILLLGAVNCDPKVKYSMADVESFLEEYIVENSILELLEELMTLLQESNFFKSLQKQTTPKAKAKK